MPALDLVQRFVPEQEQTLAHLIRRLTLLLVAVKNLSEKIDAFIADEYVVGTGAEHDFRWLPATEGTSHLDGRQIDRFFLPWDQQA